MCAATARGDLESARFGNPLPMPRGRCRCSPHGALPSLSRHMSILRLSSLATIPALALAVACGPNQEHVRADSAAAQLAAQKDSLTRVVLQADDFILKADASMNRVKGLPKGKKAGQSLDPLARQVENRQLVMERVNALVARAQATAAQLAKANKSNTTLLAQIAADSAMIADLNSTIQRQTATIEGLSVRIDSLKDASEQLATTLAAVETESAKAFVVVGREDELVKKGVIVREGGANLLFVHPGRTLQIARTLPPDAFTTVDQRGLKEIPMPDSTRRYRIVSRQSLDNAEVQDRKQNTFRGNLHIADASRFWAPSKYLVVVEQ